MAGSANLKQVALVAPPAPAAPSIRASAPLGDTGYRANADAFAAQMAIFGRMRETEHSFRQRAKRDRLSSLSFLHFNRITAPQCGETGLIRRSVMQPLYTRHGNRYRAAANAEILDAAAAIIVAQTRGAMLSSPQEAARLCRSMCAGYDNERFGVVWLDSRHRVIHAETLFAGTIDGATVYPRVVVKRALEVNAAAVILTHNHPSGVAEPSEADRTITLKLSKALALVEIRLLDHLVVTGEACVSLAERGWL